MTRTTIRKHETASNYVVLIYADEMTGEPVTREFMVPHSGGYVRDERGNQVCENLSSAGSTLTAKDGNDLLRVIRAEWRKARAFLAAV